MASQGLPRARVSGRPNWEGGGGSLPLCAGAAAIAASEGRAGGDVWLGQHGVRAHRGVQRQAGGVVQQLLERQTELHRGELQRLHHPVRKVSGRGRCFGGDNLSVRVHNHGVSKRTAGVNAADERHGDLTSTVQW
jgi:hypothetical protein